jgi:hypothetical protein
MGVSKEHGKSKEQGREQIAWEERRRAAGERARSK